MCMCILVHIYAYVYVCMYIYMCIVFAMSVACTLEQVFWAPVHVQLYVFYRFSFDINVHICNIFAAGCAICVYAYICVYMHAYVYGCGCASMILFDALRRYC